MLAGRATPAGTDGSSLRAQMFQRKHHIAFVVIVIIAVATLVLYSLSDDEALAPGQNGERVPAAAE